MSLAISGAAVTRLPKAGGFHSLRFYSERHLIKVFKVLAHARRKQQNQGPLIVGCVLQQPRLQHKRSGAVGDGSDCEGSRWNGGAEAPQQPDFASAQFNGLEMGSRVRPWIFPFELHCLNLTGETYSMQLKQNCIFVASSLQFADQAVLAKKTVERRWLTVANLSQNGDFWPLETDGRQRGSIIPAQGKHESYECENFFDTFRNHATLSPKKWNQKCRQVPEKSVLSNQVKLLDQNEVLWWRPLLLGPDCLVRLVILKSPNQAHHDHHQQLTRTIDWSFLDASNFRMKHLLSRLWQCHAFFFEKQVKTWGCKLMSCLVSFLC